LHLQQNEFEAAKTNLQQAITLDRNHLEARANLGLALLRSGRPTEAVEAYSAALKIAPRRRDFILGLEAAQRQLQRVRTPRSLTSQP
jgi:Flp pilus assembly protein TadD